MLLEWWQGGKRHRLPIGTDGVARPRAAEARPVEVVDTLDEVEPEWEGEPLSGESEDPVAHVLSPAEQPDPVEGLAMKQELAQALARFKMPGQVGEFMQGPVITRYAFRPGAGLKISKLAGLQRDIALELAVDSVRVD